MTEQAARVEIKQLAALRGFMPPNYKINVFHDAEGDYLLRLDPFDGSLPIRVYFDPAEKPCLYCLAST